MKDDDLPDRLRLARTEGVGPITYRRLLRRYGTAAAALDALPGLAATGGRAIVPVTAADAAREIEAMRRRGARLLFLDTPDYPPLLALLEDAPPVLAVLGRLDAADGRAVALVGSRNASANGQRIAEQLGEALAAAGLTVVSGLARGIDAAAHRGALRAGRTIAAVAGGLDMPYPPEHADLQRAVAERGAVLTEAPLGTAPQARHFPRRNRLIAGLSLGVVVVEAAPRSGSLITARLAQEAGRELFAVPGSPLDPRCRGANDLIRQGAHLVETVADVLADLPDHPFRQGLGRDPLFRRGPPPALAEPAADLQDDGLAPVGELDLARQRLRDLLSPAPASVDDLVRRCQLSAAAVMAALLELELAGRVEALPGGRFALIVDPVGRPGALTSQDPMPDVVVVESPAKAKTINKYLGDHFTVLASFGHVRDLPPKDGSVRPEQDFAMDWESDARGEKQVAAIAKALKGADTLYLATDPDREGEAISWHVRAMLDQMRALRGVDVRRVTFNEITRSAVTTAMAHPRELDQPLIEAYLARRALDYLVGFTLSPVLWRKLPGSRSAGRVQSVALRLICEREAEIEAFRAREYWTIEAVFTTPGGATFTARLTHLDGRKLDQFDLNNEALAEAARRKVEAGVFTVGSVERKRVKRHPPPPFTTSTLQQEASRKLGFGAQQTMRLAQQLYEGVDVGGETVGLITYMRTDGVQMAREAMFAIRDHVKGAYGADYIPGAPREYATKAKNAQEAHEAIRPTDVGRTPDQVARHLNPDQRRLYELVWKRAVASQMQSAELDQVTVEVVDGRGTILRATGSIVAFDGFLKLYREDTDDKEEGEEEGRMLPAMAERDRLARGAVTASQHFTQPPPRYSEASLVKKMEELGIGRPSTYASILSVLQDRNYVRLDKRRFIPEDRGRLVTAFLVSFFNRYVDTGFTATLEEQLDDISGGRADWRSVMRAFWDEFSRAVEQTKDLKISDVINALDQDLGPHFFPPKPDGSDPRGCPACGSGRLGLRLGRFGSFIGCSNYPACQFTRRLVVEPGGEEGGDTLAEGVRVLGRHSDTDEEISIRRGPYGLYVQQGEAVADKPKQKPKRTSIPRGMDAQTMTLEEAIALVSLPRLVGIHPETKEPIEAGVGRFGPYVKMGAVFGSLDRDDNVLVVGLNRAVDLLAKKMASVRTLGPHPKGGELVTVRKGRFGPYVQHDKTVANLPRGVAMDDVTLGQAVALLAEKGKPLRPKGAKKGAKKPGARANGANGAAAEAAERAARPSSKATKPKAVAKPGIAKRAPKAAGEPPAGPTAASRRKSVG